MMRRRYWISGGVIAILYAVNRFLLIPCTGNRLLAWHGADFLAGGLMVCLLSALLERSGRPPLGRWLPATAFLLGCGLFWEYVTPLYLARSVSDPRDLVAVWLGGMGMLAIFKYTK